MNNTGTFYRRPLAGQPIRYGTQVIGINKLKTMMNYFFSKTFLILEIVIITNQLHVFIPTKLQNCFVKIGFISFWIIPFRFVSIYFVSFRFRFISIYFVSFRFVSIYFVSFRFDFVSHFTGTPFSCHEENETKRNKSKRNETKRNKSKWNEIETKRNKSKRNETE
jgi:hypothetical protein